MFSTPYDIANRALQHLGQPRITTFADLSKQASETAFCYDKSIRAELRGAGWNFSTRRMVMRTTAINTSLATFATYSATTSYTAGDIVQDTNGYLWLAAKASTGVTPGIETGDPKWITYYGALDTAIAHVTTTTYLPGDLLFLSSVLYLCVSPSLNHVPPNATYWHVVQGGGATGATTFDPGGYNRDGSNQRTAFRLPANFMRLVAQDPKQPATSHQTLSAGMRWSDWELENGIIYSATLTGPTIIRFVADTRDVYRMDDLFCEAVAARMAMSLTDVFSASKEKAASIMQTYRGYILRGIAMASIEAGSTEEVQPAGAEPQQPQGQ